MALTTRWSRTASTPTGKLGSEMKAAVAAGIFRYFLHGKLHGRAVRVGDLLPLGQRPGERLAGIGVLGRPRLRDRVALDREVSGGALIQVG